MLCQLKDFAPNDIIDFFYNGEYRKGIVVETAKGWVCKDWNAWIKVRVYGVGFRTFTCKKIHNLTYYAMGVPR